MSRWLNLGLLLVVCQIVAFVMARGPSGVDCTLAGVQGLGCKCDLTPRHGSSAASWCGPRLYCSEELNALVYKVSDVPPHFVPHEQLSKQDNLTGDSHTALQSIGKVQSYLAASAPACFYVGPGVPATAGSKDELNKGHCLPCSMGDYCQEGTVVLKNYTDLDALPEVKDLTMEELLQWAYIPPFPPQDLPRTSEARSLLDDLSSRSGFSNSQDWLASLKSPYELAQMLQTFSSPKSVNKMKQLACPAGSYCPEPSTKHACKPGSWCPTSCKGLSKQPQGITADLTCDIEVLLTSKPQAQIQEFTTAYIAGNVVTGKQLVHGNTCLGTNTSNPSEACKAGHFCPTPGIVTVCPPGYFCPEGSIEPLRCPLLAKCGKGSVHPGSSWIGPIGLSVVSGVVIAAIVYANRAASSLAARMCQEAQEKANFHTILTAAGLPLPSTIFFRQVHPKLTISFEDLTLELKKNGKSILNGITGTFYPATVVGILGGSGCGKTTFLNVLCGKATYGKMGGEVRVNGHKVRDMVVISKVMGFVPQDDIVHEDLTVQENFAYQAKIRLPRHFSRTEIRSIVHSTADLLQLSDFLHCVVGSVERRGISGGQRKRVNVGMELVRRAQSFGVASRKEPTLVGRLHFLAREVDFLSEIQNLHSGLDATASLAVLNGLKKLTGSGLTSIMVIHQPRYSIFNLLDQVLLLGAGGHQVFLGHASQALDYFEWRGFPLPPNVNPADHFLDCMQGQVACDVDPNFQPQDMARWYREWDGLIPGKTPRASDRPLQLSASRNAPVVQRVLAQKFDEMDHDRDGCITARELCQYFQSLSLECSMEQAQNMIDYLNGRRRNTADGLPLDKITRERFLQWGAMDQAAMLQQTGSEAPAPAPPPNSRLPVTDAAETGQGSSRSGVEIEMEGLGIPLLANGERDDDGRLSSSGFSRERAVPPILRQTGHPVHQYFVVFKRSFKKWMRGWDLRILDYGIIIIVATLIAEAQGSAWEFIGVPMKYMQLCLGFGVISTVASLNLFGGKTDQTVHWREVRSGFNPFAVFAAKASWDMVDVCLRPLLWTIVYWSLTMQRVGIGKLYVGMLMISWWCTGLGYIVSIVVPPESSVVAGAAIPLILAGFVNGVRPSLADYGSAMLKLSHLSYARWEIEYLTSKWFEAQPPQFRPKSLGVMHHLGFCSSDYHWGVDYSSPTDYQGKNYSTVMDGLQFKPCQHAASIAILVLVFEGLFLRVLACISLWVMGHWKQA